MKGRARNSIPEAPGNLCVDWPGTVPDEQNEREVAEIIKSAPHVARVSVINQRMVVASHGDARRHRRHTTRRTTATRCTPARKSADALRGQAAAIMGVPNEKLRVITEDVGGAFGMKTTGLSGISGAAGGRAPTRPAGALAVDAFGGFHQRHAGTRYRHRGRTCDRREGQIPRAARAPLCNQGAYVANAGIGINTNNFARCLPGMYRIPKVDASVACYFSNTVPIGALSRRRAAGSKLRA